MEFKLGHNEIHSALWIRLKEYYEARLITLRQRNDGDLDQIATARVRGRIQEIRNFLALENQAPEVGIND